MNEQEMMNKIFHLKDELDYYRQQFWELTSSIDTWHFWFNWISVLIPLVLLYFFMDRKSVFELGFFWVCYSCDVDKYRYGVIHEECINYPT